MSLPVNVSPSITCLTCRFRLSRSRCFASDVLFPVVASRMSWAWHVICGRRVWHVNRCRRVKNVTHHITDVTRLSCCFRSLHQESILCLICRFRSSQYGYLAYSVSFPVIASDESVKVDANDVPSPVEASKTPRMWRIISGCRGASV